MRRTFALLAALSEALPLLPAIPDLPLSHVPHGLRDADGAADRAVVGPYVIQKLREFQIGQYIREEGPQAHQKKAGTPTMGGVLICDLRSWCRRCCGRPVQSVRLDGDAAMLAFGAIGFADDYIKVAHKREPRAHRPRQAGAADHWSSA